MDKNFAAQKIELLITYAKSHLMLSETNESYVRNRLMELLGVEQPTYATDEVAELIEDILLPLSEYALAEKLIDIAEKDRFETRLIDTVMPMPSAVVEHFDRLCANEGMRAATSWFYEFGKHSNYIRAKDIKKNIIWSFSGKRGDITVTINLSKPEKDNRDVAAARSSPQTDYPKCVLCATNVGYGGKAGYPAKYNLRTIPVPLGDELWHFQFSPYSYYNQHCIALSDTHKPMHLDISSFNKMYEFVSIFPHYFIGSNAPLPIVGGSILTHDHYQGGSKTHPIFKRPVYKQYKHADFAGVKAGIVDWYNSVIRLKSKNQEGLLKAVQYIYESWAKYSDKDVSIIAKTSEQHNTITPIFRLERGELFAELVLRNNRTDEAHPFGIFHPTEDMHNIKKEGIGIIEVMGTFILPGRLAKELHGIAPYLTGKKSFNEKELSDSENPLFKHRYMITELLIKYGKSCSVDKASEAITDYVNGICEKILECTGVFKRDALGEAAFERFIASLGFTKGEAGEAPEPYKAASEAKNSTKTSATSATKTSATKPVKAATTTSATKASTASAKESTASAKEAIVTSESLAEAAAKTPPAEPEKRKRGRPRKNPL